MGRLRVSHLGIASHPMSCVPITPEMTKLLEACRSWPISPEALKEMRATEAWRQARAWGWIMESGELTGTGHRHAGDQPKGILPTDSGLGLRWRVNKWLTQPIYWEV